MSLIVNNNNQHLVDQEFDNINQNFISSLPNELVLEIFSYLNLTALGTICHVSKEWKRLASSEPIKIAVYKKIAFGHDHWAQFFGKDVIKEENKDEEFSEFSTSYLDIIGDCRRYQKAFPEENENDGLMLVRLPKTLNGQLTSTSFGELAKKYFPNSDTGYRFIWSAIVDELGSKSIDKSRWVLMTKDVLPGSRGKSYAEQQGIVANLAQKALIGYEIPETLEAIVCILAQYFRSNMRLFNDNPWTYTRCKDNVQGYQTIVGGFAPAGLNVNFSLHVNDYIGVAALRKF